MVARRRIGIGVCVVLVAAFTGCPLAGSMVTGVWKGTADTNCDGETDLFFILVLAGDGTATFQTANDKVTGTWSVEDGMLSVVFMLNEFTTTFTAAAGPDTLEGTIGTDESTNGCWEATNANV